MEDANPSFQNLPDSNVVTHNRSDARARGDTVTLPSDPAIGDFDEFQTHRGGSSQVREGRGGRGHGGGRGQGKEHKSWAEVAAPSIRSTVPLRYVPPIRNEGYVSVELPPQLPWKMGFMPNCCKSVLEGGPWYVGGFNLILKQWTRMMKLTKEKATKVPVWVRLFNVPLEYWDNDGLSRIASAVGVPLFMDHLIEEGSRVSFARVCVEIEASSNLPAMFNISCGGNTIVVRVEYQGLPAKCDHCIAFGHNTSKCDKTQVEHLVNLQKETEDNPDPGWSTVKAKGKRKVGDPEPVPEPIVQNEEAVVQLEEITENLEVGLDNSNNIVLISRPVGLNEPSVSDKIESSHDGEIDAPNIAHLEGFQKELVELTKLALPHDTELITKVENLVASTQAQNTPAKKQIQQKSTAKGSSSGKGKSQRKKQRGFNDSSRHKEVKRFLLNEDVKVLGILETKIKAVNENAIFSSCFNNWTFLSNSQPTKTGPCFVYAENKHTIRKEFFEYMVKISQSQSNYPLVFLGDFNATRYQYEKFESSPSWSAEKEEFNSHIIQSDLVDLSYGGCQFTWANKRVSGEYIATKIDRVLVNEGWLDLYPTSTGNFLTSSISDHSPAVVTVSDVVVSFKKPFKFFDFWLDHEEFLPAVSQIWNEYIRGVPMFRVCQKLRQLKPVFKSMNKKKFSDNTRVLATRSELNSVQWKLDKDPSNLDLQSHESTLYKQYVDLTIVEESLLIKNLRGKILKIELQDGRCSNKLEDIQSAFITFYSDLFGTPINDHYGGFDRINSLVKSKVSTDQALLLARPVTDLEIKDVFWSLKPNKAPGLDGYSAGFFKKSWSIVGKEVTQAIRTFFEPGKLLSKVNSTIIALIPKVPNPVRVEDYRPISCCNTIYKCIAKIIANRVKVVLPDLIDPVQSAFVQGRRISDNIFLSQELMRGYHKSSPTPRCAMKVDIMKAYDSVRWEFIIDILKAMDFPPIMTSWIKACITSPSFSVCINGSLHSYFKGARGLRQGDPMSPYLLVLAMEILARIFDEKSNHPLFKFHWRCEKAKIVNLCFADDGCSYC
ncbi:uncharacterized protein LOC114284753 [Camellia sinensis]|uniref:uncharacterized protein LOC114284753 n=1 Tax=Camellia sinensis TaxID=4442 RepID=UPI001035B5E3|nr:uncharacterized protein LOC114284753 [Camellia sinensis]